MEWTVFVKLGLALATLVLGAEWLVKGAGRLALSFRVTPVFIGVTVVALGSSAPELFIAKSAALTGDRAVSLGDIIGSNICNVALVLGLSALIRPLPIPPEMFSRDMPAMLVASSLFVVLLYIGGPDRSGDSVTYMITRPKAAVMLAAMGVWLWILLRSAKENAVPEDAPVEAPAPRTRLAALMLVGLAALMAGSFFTVQACVQIATWLQVPQLVLGLAVVALGTSLPELTTSLVAAWRGQSEISLSNIVGSNIVNLLFVAGAAALVSPLPIDVEVLRGDLPVMLLVAVLLPLLAWRPKKLGRLAGGLLLAIYAVYILNLFFAWL